MEGITPPLALCTYTAMGIANSKMKETLLNSLIFVGLHYMLSVIMLLGFLPILGL
jgi:TRAP-type C4-dicarboxylate transport system permease large subunit